MIHNAHKTLPVISKSSKKFKNNFTIYFERDVLCVQMAKLAGNAEM